jgi:hypothetical protein
VNQTFEALLGELGLRPEEVGPPVALASGAVAQGFAGGVSLASLALDLRVAWVEVPGVALTGIAVDRAAEQPWALAFARRDGAALRCKGTHLSGTSPAEILLDTRDASPRLVTGPDGAGALVIGGPAPVVCAVAPTAVEVPMSAWWKVARDPWLEARIAALGAHPSVYDAALLAGDLVRLAPAQPPDLQALLAGEAASPLAEAVHPWVAALNARQCAVVQARVDAEAARLGAAVQPLIARFDPEDAGWCADLARWLSDRDEAASAAWVVTAAGQRHGDALAELDGRHRAEFFGLVDLPDHPHDRLDRARADEEAWWAEIFP